LTTCQAAWDTTEVADQIGNESRGVICEVEVAAVEGVRGPESREGFTAFIEKRSPDWVPEHLCLHKRL
jgi:hypothetical protein